MDFLERHKLILNPQQEKAVMQIGGAMLLLAVPGSGKTTVIIARLGNMIFNHGVDPQHILNLTFSKASALDMKARFSKLFGIENENLLEFRTIHSFSLNIIKEYELYASRKAHKILENNISVIRRIYIDQSKEYAGDEIINEISQKIGYCKNMMYGIEEIKEIQIPGCDFFEIYNSYDEYKKVNKLMDFDDILNYSLVILKKYPDVLQKFQDKYTYINVDEAQDTSFLQHEIIRLLVEKNGNIFMVGDEDQSIYGFRGAFPKALLNFEVTYKNSHILKMERNYRSTKNIVKAADFFIRQNKQRFQKNMFSDNVEGSKIKCLELSDLASQYKRTANLLLNEYKNKEVAVLFRNNDSAIPLVDALDYNAISFSIRESTPTFFNHFITTDIVNFMLLALDKRNLEAFKKIYYKMNCNVNKIMYEFVKERTNRNIFETLLEYPKNEVHTTKKIYQRKDDFEKLLKMRPLQAIDYILDNMGYSYYLKNLAEQGYSIDSLNRKLSILRNIAVLRNSLDDFIKRLGRLEEIMKKTGTNNSLVTLTTIHSSKGLEFENVFILDAIDGLFPSIESIKQKEDQNVADLLEEETRLFYVAITRAKNELLFFSSKTIYGVPMKTSRFISYLNEFWNNSSQRTSYVNTTKPTGSIFEVGDRVSHSSYGKGTLTTVSKKNVKVHFDNYGLREVELITLKKRWVNKEN